jgi:hypothetical protein
MSATNEHAEPRDVAGDLIGRLILAFGDMEYQVSLCLHRLAAIPEFGLFAPIADTLVLKQKLDVFKDMVVARFADSPACLDEFVLWHRRLCKLRRRRDGLIHGYWDHEINALRPMKFKKHSTMTCNLAELREECRRTEALRASFRGWRERWLVQSR